MICVLNCARTCFESQNDVNDARSTLYIILVTLTDVLRFAVSITMITVRILGIAVYVSLDIDLGDDGYRLESLNFLIFMAEVFVFLQDIQAAQFVPENAPFVPLIIIVVYGITTFFLTLFLDGHLGIFATVNHTVSNVANDLINVLDEVIEGLGRILQGLRPPASGSTAPETTSSHIVSAPGSSTSTTSIHTVL